ncbi:hypothetical protein P0W64_20760 [Tsukamurella sp. 8F]|uniref:hypothetical protein n=1 Tax=unclassified Tsukamurella TaxID=2633480 RepID=UPI0023B9B77B|nr:MULTISPECIES: hypothetical protein [unclassified Tsukamurella]MDF0532106.1 hypothetical protein [Tsukamurella sp. 8J]MDF0589216.1 hypothetical protein [Tsukamurella sp. 8F]
MTGLIGVALLAIGLGGAATKAEWAWMALVSGLVVLVIGAAMLAVVSASRRRLASEDRGQRDPVLGESIGPEEESKYLRRYRPWRLRRR